MKKPAWLALAVLSSLGVPSCNAFRRHTHDQIREGETFTVSIEEIEDPGERFAIAGAGATLVAAAIGEVVSFATSQLKAHFERVALLHEAEYSASAATMIGDGRAWIVELERSARVDGKPVVVLRAAYRLESHATDGGLALVLRPQTFGMTHAAARLADADDSFDVGLSFAFSTVAKGSGEDAELATTKLGDPLVHQRRVQLASEVPDSNLVSAAKQESGDDETKDDGSPHASAAVGVVALPTTAASENHLLAVAVTVNERDPSRARERNEAAAKSVETLAPLLAAYAKELAGVKSDAAKR